MYLIVFVGFTNGFTTPNRGGMIYSFVTYLLNFQNVTGYCDGRR